MAPKFKSAPSLQPYRGERRATRPPLKTADETDSHCPLLTLLTTTCILMLNVWNRMNDFRRQPCVYKYWQHKVPPGIKSDADEKWSVLCSKTAICRRINLALAVLLSLCRTGRNIFTPYCYRLNYERVAGIQKRSSCCAPKCLLPKDLDKYIIPTEKKPPERPSFSMRAWRVSLWV